MKLRLAWLGLLLIGKAAQAEPEYRTEYKTTVRADRDLQEAATVTLGREEARRLPGTADDALRAVESAAGVARAALGSGQLVVWGAAPQDSRVLIDGVEVPSLYHLGGLRTILPTAMVKEVSLSPGGFGAEHGRALGGLVAVATALPSEAGFHGSLSVDALDAGHVNVPQDGCCRDDAEILDEDGDVRSLQGAALLTTLAGPMALAVSAGTCFVGTQVAPLLRLPTTSAGRSAFESSATASSMAFLVFRNDGGSGTREATSTCGAWNCRSKWPWR